MLTTAEAILLPALPIYHLHYPPATGASLLFQVCTCYSQCQEGRTPLWSLSLLICSME